MPSSVLTVISMYPNLLAAVCAPRIMPPAYGVVATSSLMKPRMRVLLVRRERAIGLTL